MFLLIPFHECLQKGAVLAIYTSYTSLYKIIQYNLLFLVLAIYTSYTSLYKIIQHNLLFLVLAIYTSYTSLYKIIR